MWISRSPVYYDIHSPRRDWTDYVKIGGALAMIVVIGFFATDYISGVVKGKSTARYGKIHDKQYGVTYTTDDEGYRTKHESWILEVCVAGEKFSNMDVSHSQYDNVTVGDHVRIAERYGGITGWSYGYTFEAKVDPRSIPAEGGR